MKNDTAAITHCCSMANGLNLNGAELPPVSKNLEFFSSVAVETCSELGFV